MRIQISPWEITKTSFRVPTSNRRRKSSIDENGSRVNGNKKSAIVPEDPSSLLHFSASFVELSRRKYKSFSKKRIRSTRNCDEPDVLPTAVLTGQHQIGVIGKAPDNTLAESENLQFTSPPGEATSFLPRSIDADTNGSRANKDLPSVNPTRVPAIYDGQQDRVYAFQRGNTKLVCWNALSSFRDILSITGLSQPAISLSLVQVKEKSLLIGSCRDGTEFVVHCSDIQGDKQLRIEYIPSAVSWKGSHYVGSLYYVVSKRSDRSSTVASPKRALRDESSPDADCSIVVLQVFAKDDKVLVSRKEVDFDDDCNIRIPLANSSRETATTFSLFSGLPHDTSNKVTIEQIKVLGFVEGHGAVCISFTAKFEVTVEKHAKNGVHKKSDHDSKKYFVSLSLGTGRLLGAPVKLPEGTRKASLAGPTLLAAETSSRSIILYDAVRGGRISCQSIETLGNSDAKESSIDLWTLITDKERTRLAVLYALGDVLYFACAKIHMTSLEDISASKPLSSNVRISLSTGLQSCFTRSNAAANLKNKAPYDLQRSIVSFRFGNQYELYNASTQHRKAVEYATSLLNEAITSQIDAKKQNGVSQTGGLLVTFEKAVNVFARNEAADAVALAANAGASFGMQSSSTRKLPKNLIAGGSISSASNQPCRSDPVNNPLHFVPQAFIDATTQLLIKYLRMPSRHGKANVDRDADSREILQRIIRSGKVSSRLLFQTDSTENLEGDPSSISAFLELFISISAEFTAVLCSPAEIVFDIVDHCFDVTERQMVGMLGYLMSKARPIDVASYFMRNTTATSEYSCHNVVNRYISLLEKGAKTKEEQIEQDALSQRLIIVGVTTFIRKITAFSDPNESLLRSAIGNELSKEETLLASQLFIKTLSAPGSIAKSNESSCVSRRKLIWLSTLYSNQRSIIARAADKSHASTIAHGISPEIQGMEHLFAIHQTKRQRFTGSNVRKVMAETPEGNDSANGETHRKKHRADNSFVQMEFDSDAYVVEML